MSTNIPDSPSLQLGRRLRELRERLCMTQAQLGGALGITDRTIKNYEAGTSTIPSDVLLSMLGLGMDIGYLLGIKGSSPMAVHPIAVDEEVLRDVVNWVDGEWTGSEPMDDFERSTWIVREYLASIRTHQSERLPTAMKSGKRKANGA